MGLSALSENIRNFIKASIIVFFIIVFIWLAWMVSRTVSKALSPKEGKATAFGKIAAPSFVLTYPHLESDSWQLANSLPNFEDNQPVYQILQEKLLDEQIKKILSFFSINQTNQKRDGNKIIFKGEETKILTLLEQEGKFVYTQKPTLALLKTKVGLSESQAVDEAKSTLKKLGLLTDDIKDGAKSVSFVKIEDSQTTTSSPETANAVEVSLFRKVGKFYSWGEAPVKLTFVGSEKKIAAMSYLYTYIDPLGSPYPIVDTKQAWEKVQKGQSYTKASLKATSVKVNSIQLAYWESKYSSSFLTPFWIFDMTVETPEGEKKIQAFLPAIDSSFLGDLPP